MSYGFYKILHVVGIALLMVALGGLTLHAINGGDKASNAGRKLVSASHGVALALVLVAGFGMLARLGIHWPWPGYLWGKLAIWLLLGAALVIPYRKPELARPLWLALPVLVGVAAWLAVAKPF